MRSRVLGLTLVFVSLLYFCLSTWKPVQPESTSQNPTGDAQVREGGIGSVRQFVYHPPWNRSVLGRPFNIRQDYLRHLALPPTSFVELTPEVADQFVFVSAVSNSFMRFVRDTVGSIHQFQPGRKIIIYGLTLNVENIYKLRGYCDVEVRRFNFTKYPSHVRELHSYAWKPLIIAEVLKEYPGVLWLDSSVRLITSDFSSLMVQVVETGGAVALSSTGHSTYYATYPQMYEYLPTNMSAAKTQEQREATLLLYRTRHVMENVVQWLAYCALERHCIAPDDARLRCINTPDHFVEHGRCHRFDQSAINLLLLNAYDLNSHTFYIRHHVLRVERSVEAKYQPQLCLHPIRVVRNMTMVGVRR